MLRADFELARNGFELGVSLEVEVGKCLALSGPSGSGKSTALRTIAGLTAPTHGHIQCGDQLWLDTSRRIDVSPERRRCGFVFQDYALFQSQRCWQNVAYGLRHLSRSERRDRAVEMLGRFGLSDRARAHPSALSGGERQRVALARALAPNPSVLLLDEPLSALDTRTRKDAGQVLAEVLRKSQVPTVLVTHDFQEAALFGDQIAVLDRGRLVQQGTAAELAASPVNAFVADFSGAVVLIGTARIEADAGTAIDLDGGGLVRSTAMATGRVAASVYPWEISLDLPGRAPKGSMRNHISATVRTITVLGSRVRIGLEASQPLVAEITEASLSELSLMPGSPVLASWKAAATRISAL